MSKPATQSPEAVLKKLRRLDGNMRCPNCDSRAAQGIGFGNICVKYKTFVCDMCKTSHQAISHRVKSVSMSTWTMDEVRELMDEYGGGNDAARHTWLANAPPCGSRYNGGNRPREGDKIEHFKQFVIDCYELGKFRATTQYVSSSKPSAVDADTTPPVSVKSRRATPSNPPSTASSAKVDNAVAVDLLDVDDSFSNTPTQGLSHHSSFDALSAIATPTNFAPQMSQAGPFDPFAFPAPASTPASQQPVVDPFAFPAPLSTPAMDPFISNSSGASSISNHSTAQVSRASSIDDILSIPTPAAPVFTSPTAASSSDFPLSKAEQPVYDPFGNDVLTPSSRLPADHSKGSIESLTSSFAQQASFNASNGTMYPQQQSNSMKTAYMPSQMTITPMNSGLNSGLAISSMSSLLPSPPMMQQPAAFGMRPPATGYPAPAFNASPMYNAQYNRPSPSYNASYGSSNRPTPSNQIGAFDFVDDELKASTRR
jgi:hypothetical protein